MQTGTCTVTIIDTTGRFDPTNTGGPYYGNLDPDKQISIWLKNPTNADAAVPIFTGFIESIENDMDVSAKFSTVTITGVDLLDRLANTEIVPDGSFGSSVNGAAVTYLSQQVDDRIKAGLLDSGWTSGNWTIYSGNVSVQDTVYDTGSPTLQVIQDAHNAEFPGVAVFFIAKTGLPTFYGRLARFNPTNPAYSAIGSWDVADQPNAASNLTGIAQLSTLKFARDKGNIINACIAYPNGIADTDLAGQVFKDAGSITNHGVRSQQFEHLVTLQGDEAGTPDALAETLKYATYHVTERAAPATSISEITFLTQAADSDRGVATWDLMCGVELSDYIASVTTTHPGGGGFGGPAYFVEHIHYAAEPMKQTHPKVDLTLQLSPASYFPPGDDPFA